ncbi:MAG: hypothetical protein ACYCYO_03850 [Bacilli bacterium]
MGSKHRASLSSDYFLRRSDFDGAEKCDERGDDAFVMEILARLDETFVSVDDGWILGDFRSDVGE